MRNGQSPEAIICGEDKSSYFEMYSIPVDTV